MATQQPIQPAEETLHHLHRLSQKPGVQSTLVLSRDTGAIVRASGLLVSDTPTTPSAATDPTSPSSKPTQSDGDAAGSTLNGGVGSNGVSQSPSQPQQQQQREDGDEGKLRSAEEVARSVWRFFGAAGGMVAEMRGEGEDEVKLLRLRMRRCELVVVPDAKFLLVVVHDTPAA